MNQEPRNRIIDSHLNSPQGEVEPFLYHCCELSNPSPLLTQDILCASGQDDDLCSGGGHPDLYPTVTIFGQFLGEEIVQFGFKDTISNKLGTAQHKCILEKPARHVHAHYGRYL